MEKLDHCRVKIYNRQCYTNNHCRLNYLSGGDLRDTTVGYTASRQCYSINHCRFVYPASGDIKTITAGFGIEPAGMSNHHCQFRFTYCDRKIPSLPLAHCRLVFRR